jgi:hypothetical protein
MGWFRSDSPVKKRLVITDLTRMHEGRVCVAGYDDSGVCVRPVLPPPGTCESTLYGGGQPIVFPFAVVEYDLIKPFSHPPHTEDQLYDPRSVRFCRQLDPNERRRLLAGTLSPGVGNMFEAPIVSDQGFYVLSGQGVRSLGTIQPRRIVRVVHELGPEGQWKYRLGFVDRQDALYWLTVTDLTWRYYFDYQRGHGKRPQQICSELLGSLRRCEVFLRIGLTRGWQMHPERCYLQITAVHSFPDYLKGLTFADFAPSGKAR